MSSSRPKDLYEDQRLSALTNRETLCERMTERAIPQTGLMGLSTELAVARLRVAWMAIFLPDDQHLDLGKKFVDRARAFASNRYGQLQAYREERYDGVSLDDMAAQEIWCLTGLAGVTKTAFQAALTRAFMRAYGDVIPVPGVHIRPRPIIHIQIKPKQTADDVLRSLANPLFVAGRSNVKWVDMRQHLVDWLHGQLTSLIFLDELQFLSRSESASTLIANLVSQLADLGFPLTYSCNFSLAHKLMARPHEDKDRLLPYPLVLQPPDEMHWALVVAEYKGVAPDLISIDPKKDSPELYRLSAGVPRLLRLLLTVACRIAWPLRVDRPITMADVRAAYKSHLFASQRADVEALKLMPYSAQTSKQKRTLLCPFEGFAVTGNGDELGKPVLASPLRTPAAPVVHLVESALSAGSRKVLKELRAAAEEVSEGARPAAKVTKLPKRPAVTAESLLAGLKRLRETSKVNDPEA